MMTCLKAAEIIYMHKRQESDNQEDQRESFALRHTQIVPNFQAHGSGWCHKHVVEYENNKKLIHSDR
jgi:hypothetical protein